MKDSTYVSQTKGLFVRVIPKSFYALICVIYHSGMPFFHSIFFVEWPESIPFTWESFQNWTCCSIGTVILQFWRVPNKLAVINQCTFRMSNLVFSMKLSSWVRWCYNVCKTNFTSRLVSSTTCGAAMCSTRFFILCISLLLSVLLKLPSTLAKEEEQVWVDRW